MVSLVEIVRQHTMASTGMLATIVGKTPNAIRSCLNRAAKRGFVRRHPKDNKIYWEYVRDANRSSSITETVLAYIVGHPECVVNDIAANLKIAKVLAYDYVRRHRERGNIIGVMIGNSKIKQWYVASEAPVCAKPTKVVVVEPTKPIASLWASYGLTEHFPPSSYTPTDILNFGEKIWP